MSVIGTIKSIHFTSLAQAIGELSDDELGQLLDSMQVRDFKRLKRIITAKKREYD